MLLRGVKVGVFCPSLEEPSPMTSNDESSSVSITRRRQGQETASPSHSQLCYCSTHLTLPCSSSYVCPSLPLGHCYSFRCPSAANRESGDRRAPWTFSRSFFCPKRTKSSPRSLTSHRSWIRLRRSLDRRCPAPFPDLSRAVLVDALPERAVRTEREDLW